MEFSELPNEVIFRIACLLDGESLTSFGKTNSRMDTVALEALKHVTLKIPSESVLEYLRENGHLVRSMDLSHHRLPFRRLLESVADCQHLKKLNLVNTTIEIRQLLRLLRHLPELETLSFTLEVSDNDLDPVSGNLGPSKFIKELYVEIATEHSPCKVVMDFLNECEAIEMIHVCFVGDYDSDRVIDIPPLAAARWKTLHTFVCSRWLACRTDALNALLQSIFAHKPSRECSRWINEDKEIYIYERGCFNFRSMNLVPTPKMLEEIEILRKYQVITMSGDGAYITKTPWGLPWSLRISGAENWASELNRMSLLETLSPHLKELDLTNVHGGFSGEFRLSILSTSPNLSELALPVCFFVSSATKVEEAAQKETRVRELATLTEAMAKLRLRKFTLRGRTVHRSSKVRRCLACDGELTSEHFVRLSCLDDLEELRFSLVRMDPSVYDYMEGRKLRTLGLRLLGSSDFSGLQKVSQQCPELRNLKLHGFLVRHHAKEIANALDGMHNLRQLCLGLYDVDSISMSDALDMVGKLPETLELFHLHFNTEGSNYEMVNHLARAVRNLSEARGKRILYDDSGIPMTSVRCFPMIQYTSGRALCSQQVSIGYVKPVGWDIE